MGHVTPTLASEMANEIYLVHNKLQLTRIFLSRSEFSQKKGNNQTLTAQIGSRLLNTKDSFGICARGAGDFENDIFLIFRGSTFAKYGADWLTNARIGITTSTTGSAVHAGFNSIFQSMIGDLASFINQQKGCHTIHCIGHSLGGAVANLAADWAANNFSKKVKMYSFGAPRVGFAAGGFATKLTTTLLPENIHRAYHGNDPVSMIPIFPYTHAPTSGHPYHLPYGGVSINPWAHKMGNYIKSVGGKKWPELIKPAPSTGSVKQWLESDARESTDTSTFWNKLNDAISYVVDKVITGVSVTFIAGMTAVDRLAMILKKGIDLAASTSVWVLMLVKKMMRALGMKVVETAKDITTQLLRLVLNKLTRKLYQHVSRAINGIN